MAKKKIRFPIGLKMVLMIAVFSIALVEVSMTCFSLITSSSNLERFKSEADSLSGTIANIIDVDQYCQLADKIRPIVNASKAKPKYEEKDTQEWKDYIAQFNEIEQSSLYQSMQSYLRGIQQTNTRDIDCIYLAYIDKTNRCSVYVCDSSLTDPYHPGTLDDVFNYDYSVIDVPGEDKIAYEPFTVDEEGYHLVVAGDPIIKNDVVVGYVMVDISMEHIRAVQRDNIMTLFWWLLGASVLVSVLAALISHFTLVRPIKRLNMAANSYDPSNLEETHKKIQSLRVSTRDEIEDLSDSFKNMEGDVHQTIHELVALNKELKESHEETKKMTELANKDALTGVRNKASFDSMAAALNESIFKGEDVRFGIAMIDLNDLKAINDEYGHASGNAALVKLCNLVCAIFAHSPVYRVGGDEFVVLLKNRDYDHAEELIDEFNRKIDGLRHDEYLSVPQRTSAAIGYTSYDASIDRDVEDVFERADALMYARKRQMKEEK